jgi:hypothetical protein
MVGRFRRWSAPRRNSIGYFIGVPITNRDKHRGTAGNHPCICRVTAELQGRPDELVNSQRTERVGLKDVWKYNWYVILDVCKIVWSDLISEGQPWDRIQR